MLIMIQKKTVGPVPATGVHAELLADMEATANGLVALIARERTGVYDVVASGLARTAC
jgi:hypothetical protein